MPYSPVPPIFGGALRTYYMLKSLSRHHDVTVLTYGDDAVERELKTHFGPWLSSIHTVQLPLAWKSRRLLQFYSLWTRHSFNYVAAHTRRMQLKIDEILAEDGFDIVQVEFAHMGGFQLPTDAIKILDCHNVEYDCFRRIWLNTHTMLRRYHYYLEYKKFYREEIQACRKQDAIFVTSVQDKALLERDVPGVRKFVVPNGVDTSYSKPSSEGEESWSLVFTGSMGYVPNYDGMIYFLDQIFPIIQNEIPNAKLYIVGDRPPQKLLKRATNNVIITGYVEDVRPYVWRAKVFVVPLRMGGGTRLKVLEALAMQKAIVTTSIGCEGIEVTDEESALIRDEPQAFAEAVIELLRNPIRRNRLTQNGYDLVRARYDWTVIGEQVEEVYRSIGNKPGAERPPRSRKAVIAKPGLQVERT
jgi:glycosyltransferase involved in cell wall biosynthesis